MAKYFLWHGTGGNTHVRFGAGFAIAELYPNSPFKYVGLTVICISVVVILFGWLIDVIWTAGQKSVKDESQEESQLTEKENK